MERLAGAFIEVVRTPLPDPFEVEWVGIPSPGLRDWLEIQCSTSLGAAPGATDGIAANNHFGFVGELRRALLSQGGNDWHQNDPWHPDRLVWAVAETLAAAPARSSRGAHPAALEIVPAMQEGQTSLFGAATRFSKLLARYVTDRPAMLCRWAVGDFCDAQGAPLRPDARWQAELFLAVRERLGIASPAELLDSALNEGRLNEQACGLPQRLSLFGFTTLVGANSLLAQLDALALSREVHLFMWEPSSGLAQWGRSSGTERGAHMRTTERQSFGVKREVLDESPVLPLLRSWGRPALEAAQLLSIVAPQDAVSLRVPDIEDLSGASLLKILQASVNRAMVAPAPSIPRASADGSVVIHECHGQIRQVEVVRDQILSILEEDSSLEESDIAVLCPDLTTYAPLIEAVFGPSASSGTLSYAQTIHGSTTVWGNANSKDSPPQLAYQIAHRHLENLNPLGGALVSLLTLLDGRCAAAQVSDFLSLAPVRKRFGLSDDDLARLSEWVQECSINWGLSAQHRSHWLGVDTYSPGSWAGAVQRLLAGIALCSSPDQLGFGGIAPIDVEGSDIALAGRFAEILELLELAAQQSSAPMGIDRWVPLVRSLLGTFFDIPVDQQWQMSSLLGMLASIERDSRGGSPDASSSVLGESVTPTCQATLALIELRTFLGAQLSGTSSGGRLFRGGITVSSLAALRGVPFQVIFLLGCDEEALRAGSGEADDLIVSSPMIGDRDRRSDLRQSLLEAVMSAREQLVVTRTGWNRVNNHPVPMPAALAELADTCAGLLGGADPAQLNGSLLQTHPCNSFDPANFRTPRQSFDPVALNGAMVAAGQRSEAPPVLSRPLAPELDLRTVELVDLIRTLQSPPQAFLSKRLGLHIGPTTAESAEDEIPISLDSLGKWSLGDRLLQTRLRGAAADDLEAIEAASGRLPPGSFGSAAVAAESELVTSLLDCARSQGIDWGLSEALVIECALDPTTTLFGSVTVIPSPGRWGPVQVGVGKLKGKRILQAWVDLLALTATQAPRAERCVAILIGKSASSSKAQPVERRLIELRESSDPRGLARGALVELVALYRWAHCDVVPIFSETSYSLSPLGKGASEAQKAWLSTGPGFAYGDRLDPATMLAFGDLEFEELMELETRDEDFAQFGISPGTAIGSPTRATFYSRLLWGIFDRSCVLTDDLEALAKKPAKKAAKKSASQRSSGSAYG